MRWKPADLSPKFPPRWGDSLGQPAFGIMLAAGEAIAQRRTRAAAAAEAVVISMRDHNPAGGIDHIGDRAHPVGVEVMDSARAGQSKSRQNRAGNLLTKRPETVQTNRATSLPL
jgi:hypothetical protein